VTGAPAGTPRVAVLADDLIWATRLADGLGRAGAEPVPVRSLGALAATMPAVAGCLVDLTARAYDGVAAIRAAAGAGLPVIAVGQHDDAPLRRAATEAGAARVHSYRALFEHGERALEAWVATLETTPGRAG
jgi:hypothetical protein